MPRTWDGASISPLQTEHATALRVPILDTFNPAWDYITGIVVQDLDEPQWPNRGQMPTDDEVELVAGRLQVYYKWYGTGSFRRMREFAPYDIDGGANLAYFIKWDNGGWGYRKRTWEHGPMWVPSFGAPPETLEQVIERTRR